jgi:hypothetical protein
MNIEELVSGKGNQEEIDLKGVSIPVSALKGLLEEGYSNLEPYSDNKTVSVWGKTSTACFTEEELRDRGAG